jgi:hypothetical protein
MKRNCKNKLKIKNKFKTIYKKKIFQIYKTLKYNQTIFKKILTKIKKYLFNNHKQLIKNKKKKDL